MPSSASPLSSRQGITVRPAGLSDLDILVRFSAAMAEETEGRELDLERLRQGTAAVLASTERGEYLVAETEAAVIGQLLITYEWSDWRNGTFWWIQSVYVEPTMRRQGIFRTLHDYVLQEAQRRSDVCGIRLYVEKDNAGARAAYSRLGMLLTAYQVYEQDFTL
jgi:GNAT superfamily N-acetyltransferase